MTGIIIAISVSLGISVLIVISIICGIVILVKLKRKGRYMHDIVHFEKLSFGKIPYSSKLSRKKNFVDL